MNSYLQIMKSEFNFVNGFLQNFNDNIEDKSFFSDEAWFELSGYVNSQNMRMWSAKNRCLTWDEQAEISGSNIF
jgi:hypothetical protein